MEILRGTSPVVEFSLPTNNTEVDAATYSFNGGAPQTLTVTVTDGIAKAQLPYLPLEGEAHIVWTFKIGGDTFDESEFYTIVTPYLSMREIEGMGLSADEAKRVEAAVRHIINAHTGQSFGFEKNKTITVEGHGDTGLRLPQRLVELKGIATLSEILDHRAAITTSDGWYLKKSWANATPRPDPSDIQFWGYYGGNNAFNNTTYKDYDDSFNPGYNSQSILDDPTISPVSARPGGVTVAPNGSGKATPWKADYPFEIWGDWGYKRVPDPVKEAARLLVNDYACSEQLYRDRYLESIKAADWRLQFSERAWDYTGNARADHLLSEFVLMDWWVI